jgi:hypothetical protein
LGVNYQPEQDHLSFSISRTALRGRILIPKYYDPELAEAAELASGNYDLKLLSGLLLPGAAGSRLGSWVRREHYGTGAIPFVRTSDLNGWRLRPDYKKGVSSDVHDKVAKRQDVRAGDILMVAHGTYLVGSVAIVTESDLPLVLQDHVFRLRVAPSPPEYAEAPIDNWLVLASLSTQFVRRQIRARQFSADIIDKVGERHLEVRLPIPRDPSVRKRVSAAVKEIVEGQTKARAAIRQLLSSDLRMTRERANARHGFSVPRSTVAARVIIPKYYDPALMAALKDAEEHIQASWVSIGKLAKDGLLTAKTGVEVGKMAYGTGEIPFIRTTDIAELELKADPRQGISNEIYDKYAGKAALAEGDVILIRDGTYLVGSSALVSSEDLPALICEGIYRLRSVDRSTLSPATLLGLLNLPVVRWQMRARQFTRDVIDTLGHRVFEVMIPDPASQFARDLGTKLLDKIQSKASLRVRIVDTVRSIEPKVPPRSRNRPGWSMRG